LGVELIGRDLSGSYLAHIWLISGSYLAHMQKESKIVLFLLLKRLSAALCQLLKNLGETVERFLSQEVLKGGSSNSNKSRNQ